MELLKRKNRNQFIIVIGFFIFISGIFIFTYYHFKYESISKNEEIKIEEFFDEEQTITDTIETSIEVENKAETIQITYNYVAVLEIPTINLKRGLVDPSSYYNNVNYNIQIINSSTFPDIENGNFILASHNGASYISFFKNLYKLNINDKVYVYYNNVKYEYVIENIYDTNKDGNVEIYRNHERTTITLITCKKDTKDKQVVYIGYLNNTSTY